MPGVPGKLAREMYRELHKSGRLGTLAARYRGQQIGAGRRAAATV